MFMPFSFAIIAIIVALAIALSEINPFARKQPTMLEQMAEQDAKRDPVVVAANLHAEVMEAANV